MDQKVALVTGGTRGIGLAIAKQLANQSMTVIICGRSQESAAKAASDCHLDQGTMAGYGVDVSNYEAVESLVKTVMGQHGRLDVVVNCAGITKDNLLLRMKPDEFASVVETNLYSVFNVTKQVLRPMLKQRGGVIINISSVVGCMGNAGQANYAASKAGIIGFTKSIAKEVGGKGIRVNCVAPGFIETDMIRNLPNDYLTSIIDQVPLKRLGKVDDIANLVVFLSSEQSSYITGQVIQVDGGILM